MLASDAISTRGVKPAPVKTYGELPRCVGALRPADIRINRQPTGLGLASVDSRALYITWDLL